MIKDIKNGGLLVAGALALTGCGLLDVDNPNNLTESSILEPIAATAVVNGALHSTAEAIGGTLQPYAIVADELTWIGSRDAWGSLDQGVISDPNNEFTDAEFPALGEARWMAWRAVTILEDHVANGEDVSETDLARAYFVAGLIYTFIGEMQQDFALSDKTEGAPPIGAANMTMMFDDAIGYLDQGVSLARSLGNSDLELRMLALRARAKHSRAVRQKIQPSPNTGDPLVSAGTDDAQAVVGIMGLEDWTWEVEYSPSSNDNDIAVWVNNRAENQFGAPYVTVDPEVPNTIVGYALMDPVTDEVDPRLVSKVEAFIAGEDHSPLTWLSNREAHLILAESELQGGNAAGAETHINHVRTMTGVPAYDRTAGPAPLEMLKHERRVNLFLQGRRLADMYRFGEQDALWRPSSEAVTAPGTLLPITIVEILSNPHISG